MDRLACVDLPAFPLQLLCRRHPDWDAHPVAVVAEDKPQGLITWVDDRARAARVLAGQRYAHALSLAPTLRAAAISEAEIAAGVAVVCERLRRFSPGVDPCPERPGVFWLDCSGLERLFGSVRAWAEAVAADLRDQGYAVSLAAGFSRFGTYSVARARARRVIVFDEPAAEHAAAREVPLELLGVRPRLRDDLRRLGVSTVGELLRLPAGGILQRFGAEAHRLHRLAAGDRWDPLRPAPPPEPFEEQILFDDPERDADRLLFAIKRALDPLLERLARKRHALGRLHIDFTLDRAATSLEEVMPAQGDPRRRVDTIQPAEPTLDARILLRLVHLRLESAPPEASVREILLRVDDVPATGEQLALFARKPRRDLRAANEALARLRAELGNDAVMKATVRDGHLPEARYGWEPLPAICLPNPRAGGARAGRGMIRRIWTRPRLLPPQEHRYRDDGWMLGDLDQGPVTRVVGPYIISGGWWAGDVHREYHFAETRRGDLLWVYYDRRRRRWFHHGQVE